MTKIPFKLSILLLLTFLLTSQAKPAEDPGIHEHKELPLRSDDVKTLTYAIDYFLVRKELQYSLQDVISYKEASTSILDPLDDPEPVAATEVRYILDTLRVVAFYAYDKLIFLSNARLLTLTYATQTLNWYENAFNHFTGKIAELIVELDDTTRDNLQLLLNQTISQTNQHHYAVKLLLTPD